MLINAMKATAFEFKSYEYAEGNPEVFFRYRMHFADAEAIDFTEKITLSDADWSRKLPAIFLKNILDDLHIVLGISYYKTFCPPAFKLETQLSEKRAAFWNALYTKGLGEFLHRNSIPQDAIAKFEATTDVVREVSMLEEIDETKVLVGIGGGKDSIVALELLAEYDRTGFIKSDGVGDMLAQDVADIAGVPLVRTARELDAKMLAGISGSLNGHVPISSVYAFLGILQAALTGQRYFVVANEHSSNFGNLLTEGNEVNHKWSGSSEFEKLFQSYIREELTSSVGYFSITRPFYELRVVKLFTELGEKYFDAFSSCNRNFAHNHDMEGKKWCGECPKCAFVFLMLAAFLEEEVLVRIFKKNLFEDAHLLPMYRDLLGLGDMKPFDCVGTFDESKVALGMASARFGHTKVVQEFIDKIGDTTELSKEIFRTQKALTVPSEFRLGGMESVLIVGYGKEGRTTETYLKKNYPELEVGITDMADGANYLDKQDDYDLVVKTPVIPGAQITRQYTTATNLFFSEVPREQIIGVTGSKGKSTTATLIYMLLTAAGRKVRLVGNIGVPALESILEDPAEEDELFVFELSSYQLDDLDVSPHIAVVTSLFPEHLDHHGTLEAYYAAKHNLVRYQDANDVLVYQSGFQLLEKWAAEANSQTYTPETLTFVPESSALIGAHNIANAALAFTVAKMFGVTETEAQEVFTHYEGLPHRLKNVGTYKGITFYDDSISTTPESAIAALRAIPSVGTIILGGVDRGYDFSLLEVELRAQGVENIVLFPESGTHMVQSEEGFTVLHTASMDEAIAFAYAHTKEGSSCVLSPSAPSYNLFKNFEERGDIFKEKVAHYGKI